MIAGATHCRLIAMAWTGFAVGWFGLGLLTDRASAAFPGANGRIAFSSDRDRTASDANY